MTSSEKPLTGHDVFKPISDGDNTKATNPKDLQGLKKVPIASVIPWGVIRRMALALLEGAFKYGRHNYRVEGVLASVYVDAAVGHIADWWEGQDQDPDSTICHIDKAIASLAILSEAIDTCIIRDDRPPNVYRGLSVRNDPAVDMLKRKYPEPMRPHTEQDKYRRAEEPSLGDDTIYGGISTDHGKRTR